MNGVADMYDLGVGQKKSQGVATISKFELDKEEARKLNLGYVMSGQSMMWMSSGTYMRLHVDGVLMMSDSDMEKNTNSKFIKNAHGDVMIAGLGIGLILRNLEDKVKSGVVTSITVYEKHQDVIDLVAPYFQHLPLTVKCADILEYKPPKDEMYDTIYFDIWPSIKEKNLDDTKLLHNRWKFRKRAGGWMDSWVKKYLQNEKRKSYGSYWW